MESDLGVNPSMVMLLGYFKLKDLLSLSETDAFGALSLPLLPLDLDAAVLQSSR